jgi:preprotein translocase subunit SecD
MYKRLLACCLGVALSVVVLHAQSQRLSIRAASVEPVEPWQTMRVEHCQGERCIVWVSPTATITESDIEKAQPEVRADGYRVVKVGFTDAGAIKLHDLMEAQLKKHVVLIVEGKVLWAPLVTSVPVEGPAGKNNVLTGNTGEGLAQEEVDLIMSILRPGEPR